jgi:ribose 5-phosphate isomerase A
VPFRSDEGNFILDLHLDRIADPNALSLALNQIPGVVENGLFLGICDMVVIGTSDGMVEVRDIHTGTVTHERIDTATSETLFADKTK